MIRGKKNFIPGNQLQLGFGLLFRLDEESTAKHKALEAEAGSVMSRLSLADESVQEEEEEDGEGEELKEEEEVEATEEKNDEIDEEEEEEGNAQADEGEDEFPDVELHVGDQPTVVDAGEATEYTMVKFPQPQRGPRKIDERTKYLEEKKRKEDEEAAQKKAEKRNLLFFFAIFNLSVLENNQKGPISKRQKHKLDKIKKKYQYQDDEEREYMMQLLGHKKPEEKPEPLPPRPERPPKPQQEKPENQAQADDEEDDDPEASAEGNNEDALVIEQMCSRPLNDDSLIYTVAVCAPYSSMQRFKYKVKVSYLIL